MKIFSLFFFLFASFLVYGQDSRGLYWQRCLGGYKNEGISSAGFNYEPSQSDIVPTPDVCLIIATTTTSKDGDLKGLRKYKDSTNGHDGWVVKLNSLGAIEWSRCIGGSLRDEANTVAVVNGGYIIGGSTESIDGDFSGNTKTVSSQLIYLMKLDWDGKTLWTKIYNTQSTELTFSKMIKILPVNNGNGCYMLYKISIDSRVIFRGSEVDSIGNITGFANSAGGNGDIVPTNMYKRPDGGINITGYTNATNSYFTGNLATISRGFVMEMKVSPIMVHNVTTYVKSSNADNTKIFAGATTQDSVLYLGGTFIELGKEYGWVCRRGKDPGKWWVKVFSIDVPRITQMVVTEDGGLLLSGWGEVGEPGPNGTTQHFDNYADFIIIKLDSTGKQQWTRHYGGPNNHDYVVGWNIKNENDYHLLGVTRAKDSVGKNHNIPDPLNNNYNTADIWVAHAGGLNSLSGIVFFDENKNNIRDAGEGVLNRGQVVTKSGNDTIKTTQLNNGIYSHPLGRGTYETKFILNDSNDLVTVKPLSDLTSFESTGQVKKLDFAVQPLKVISDARIEILPQEPLRPGRQYRTLIKYSNEGTKTLNNLQVTFVKDSRLKLTIISPLPNRTKGDTLYWDVKSISPFQSGMMNVGMEAEIPPKLNLNDTIVLRAMVSHDLVDANPKNDTMILEQVVTGPMDPNDKEEIHGAGFYKKLYENNEYLYYRVRFQNMGTDTAFDVVIRDTLSSKFDLSTMSLVSSSHPCTVTMEKNILVFRFVNIMLPPKQDNEEKSNGYIYFRIKPVKGLQLGDSVANTAAIYFDFNLPVITNIAKTVITPDKIIVLDNNPGNSTAGNPPASIEAVVIFPNPANEFLWLSYNGNSEAKASIILHDMNGKRIFAFPEQTFVPGQKLKLTLPNLIKGGYILSVTGDTIKQNRILLVQ